MLNYKPWRSRLFPRPIWLMANGWATTCCLLIRIEIATSAVRREPMIENAYEKPAQSKCETTIIPIDLVVTVFFSQIKKARWSRSTFLLMELNYIFVFFCVKTGNVCRRQSESQWESISLVLYSCFYSVVCFHSCIVANCKRKQSESSRRRMRCSTIKLIVVRKCVRTSNWRGKHHFRMDKSTLR